MSAQICKYTKKHGIVNCKQVNFIVYEILINKAVRCKTKQNSAKQNHKTDGQRTKRKQRKTNRKKNDKKHEQIHLIIYILTYNPLDI